MSNSQSLRYIFQVTQVKTGDASISVHVIFLSEFNAKLTKGLACV